MSNSKIEWTEKTWNPVTGCSKVSQGCKRCYAERLFPKVYPGRAFTDVQCHEDRLEAPLHWKKPAMIFVNSMSDLFHEDVPFEFIDRVFAVMALTPRHTYQVLTKRPERMLEYLTSGRLKSDARVRIYCLATLKDPSLNFFWPLPNVWLGVSVEDQKSADERIPILQETPAVVRWVSYEPALGPVDFEKIKPNGWWVKCPMCDGSMSVRVPGGGASCPRCFNHQGWIPGIDWIVCGGESGPGARPMHPDWARSVRDQCVANDVPFFFKQWGEHSPDYVAPRGAWVRLDGAPVKPPLDPRKAQFMFRVGKHAAGRALDGRTWDEYPLTSVGKVSDTVK